MAISQVRVNIFFALLTLCSALLSGCKKKPKTITFQNATKTARKSSSYVTPDGKVVRKMLEYRPLHKMTYDELKEELVYIDLKKDNQLARLYLEQMLKVCSIQEDLAAIRLRLADLYFEDKDYQKAAENYDAYVDLYPGSPYADYAAYRSVVAHSQELPTPDRDQAPTRQVVERCKKYLEQTVATKKYITEVTELMQQAYYRLFMAEVITFYFYLNRGSYGAAHKRINYIKEHCLPQVPEAEPEVLVLEYELAYARKDKEALAAIDARLLTIDVKVLKEQHGKDLRPYETFKHRAAVEEKFREIAPAAKPNQHIDAALKLSTDNGEIK